jgi:hypothetical protein
MRQRLGPGPTSVFQASRFAHLFWGRPDVYFDSLRTQAVWKPLTLRLFLNHIAGRAEIGTYPVLNDGRCRWGCIDIDEPDWDKATDVWSVWHYYGITSWVEASRSKGYHVWVFASTWVPAATMRDAGQWVNRVAGSPSKEVNPKAPAPWLTRKGLVNTVRLPYSGRAKPGRMTMLDAETGELLPLPAWLPLAYGSLCPLSRLVGLAEQWRAAEVAQAPSEPLQGSTGRASGRARQQDAWQILNGYRQAGVGERDDQFYAIANLCHGMGQPYELAIRQVETAWREQVPNKWDFPLSQALEKVNRVYGRR